MTAIADAAPQAKRPKKVSNEQRYYEALKRIAAYTPPDRMRRTAERDYGLEPDEAISYAYENVIAEAKHAIKGKRPPKESP